MCGRREGMNICMKSVKGNKEERERGGDGRKRLGTAEKQAEKGEDETRMCKRASN